MPIAPTAGPAPAVAPGSAESATPQQSFRERKAAELHAERGGDGQPTPRETRQERTPSPDAGSAEDQYQDDPQGLADDEYEDEQGELHDDPDDGAPDDVGELDDSEGNHDWEKRYKDLQGEYTRVTQERGEMTAEHSEAMGETLKLRFDLEDRMQEAVGRAEYMANVMSGNANRFRNINWSQVPPEQLPQLQAQAQQAMAMEQQSHQQWQEISGRAQEMNDEVSRREAAIAKIRLKRTIPSWGNETYAQLREFAASQGMSQEKFNSTTDPVVIEGLHALMTLRGADKNVRLNQKRKAQVPRGKTGRVSRDARGKFAKIEPNRRGSFARVAQQRLEKERRGR